MNILPRRISLLFPSLIAVFSFSSPRIIGDNFSTILGELNDHLKGNREQSAAELKAAATVIRKEAEALADNPTHIQKALYLIGLYDDTFGPLFLSESTRGGFPRQPAGGLELERVMFALQQGLIDHAYTSHNLQRYPSLYEGAVFETSTYFPGKVMPPEDPDVVHKVAVNASQPAAWGSPVLGHDQPARRPTGCYVAPGSIVRIIVPPALINKGYAIRVGAHSWNLEKKKTIQRLDRVSIVYPITERETRVTHPLGGGIYLEVPYEASAGIATLYFKNVVRAPFFSARSFAPTSLEEWKNSERLHPAPWADFESDKFMMQVPSNWIYALEDPVRLMQDWDLAMDAVTELFGLPPRLPKSVLYLQVDITMRGNANYPGYPQSNYPYNPLKDEKGKSNHWMVRGPQYADWTVFHEVGHAMAFTKFRGEVEAVVNLPTVAVLNRKFNVDLNTAFGRSVLRKEQISLDQAAIQWMITENFRQGNPMNISNKPGDEVKYQHRGYAKYVEIVNLFGWEALSRFWHSVHLDYMKGVTYPRNTDPTDSRILRMSKAAGADLTPLIHFWGVQPESPETLAKEMRKAGLRPSEAIHKRLRHYQTLIPMDNAAFRAHTELIYPKGLGTPKNLLYGEGWYSVWLPQYTAAHGEAAQVALQKIIDRYFP
ncbi:M60 family metallopeptidase [Kiritimatiellaeota bacterium B1221]|nr:M60 family metallopeptidase [Kiritimatiellaeota bacterium B1221]